MPPPQKKRQSVPSSAYTVWHNAHQAYEHTLNHQTLLVEIKWSRKLFSNFVAFEVRQPFLRWNVDSVAIAYCEGARFIY